MFSSYTEKMFWWEVDIDSMTVIALKSTTNAHGD